MPTLTNKRILITRTRHQASELAAHLEALGATPILIPTIEIVPPESFAALDAALTCLRTPGGQSYDWLLFTSPNAVEAFQQRLISSQIRLPHPSQSHREPGSPTSALAHRGGEVSGIPPAREPLSSPIAKNPTGQPPSKFPKVAVIGPATAHAANAIGLTVDLIPPQYIGESLAETLLHEAPGKSFLLVRAAEARDILPETLTAAGATVTIAEAYRNQIPPDSIPALQNLFAAPEHYPDAITFTSASTARNLFALLEAANLTLSPNIALASIGPITSEALRDLGHPPTIEAAEPTIPSLIQSLLTHLSQPHEGPESEVI
jgi:uroporphyrinogen-III synthase